MVERGTKHGKREGKTRWDLVPYRALGAVVDILGVGAVKYGDHNWALGIPYNEVFAAVMRHLTAWWCGENDDRESGKSHLAHAGCGILFLLYYSQDPGRYGGFDDRKVHTDTSIRTVAKEMCAQATHVGVGDNPSL